MESTPPDAGTAQDASTLADTIADFDRAGFAGQVRVREGGRFECLTCRRVFDASAGETGRQQRLEGASDPADMLIVVGLRCPHCGTRASAILNYGPESSIEEAEALRELGA